MIRKAKWRLLSPVLKSVESIDYYGKLSGNSADKTDSKRPLFSLIRLRFQKDYLQ